MPWVFWCEGKKLADHRHTWNTACKKAGLPGKLVHDLRRSAVRNMERAGIPRTVAIQLTGHLTESVYRRYAIVSESDLAEAVRKLENRALGLQMVSKPDSATPAGGSGTEEKSL